ncbi:hypothetical protein BGZ46_005494 [Entomortierella lignicola]|nr:hypothetical protein BGZ46_005494 [Entomortierella lignicola]
MTDYHKYIAYHTMIFLIIHILGHFVNFYRLEQLGKGDAMTYHFGTWAGVTGYWMLLLLGIMFVTAHKTIRKRSYEVFWYTHHLSILVMVFFAFHGYGCFVKTNDGQCRGYGSWRYIVLASTIYLVERALRAFESSRLIALSSAVAHPGGAIELNFKQTSIQYSPGQHVYLNIPQLSNYEWHPFTITSSPIEQFISLDIRQDGDWTRKLGRTLGYGPETPRLEQAQVVRDRSLLPLIRIDGPYGGPKEDVFNFDHAVLIGTGNGITTFSGILRHIWANHPKSLQVDTVDQRRYSEDDEDYEEDEELLSPRDRPVGSDSLISLTSISSPQSHSQAIFSDVNEEISADNIEQGDAIIGPSNIHSGRPDFTSVFEAMKDRLLRNPNSAGHIRVGVFYCGSPGLGRTLAQECKRLSSSHVRFVFSEE